METQQLVIAGLKNNLNWKRVTWLTVDQTSLRSVQFMRVISGHLCDSDAINRSCKHIIQMIWARIGGTSPADPCVLQSMEVNWQGKIWLEPRAIRPFVSTTFTKDVAWLVIWTLAGNCTATATFYESRHSHKMVTLQSRERCDTHIKGLIFRGHIMSHNSKDILGEEVLLQSDRGMATRKIDKRANS